MCICVSPKFISFRVCLVFSFITPKISFHVLNSALPFFFSAWYVPTCTYQDLQTNAHILIWIVFSLSRLQAVINTASSLVTLIHISDYFISTNSWKGNLWMKMYNFLTYSAILPLGHLQLLVPVQKLWCYWHTTIPHWLTLQNDHHGKFN